MRLQAPLPAGWSAGFSQLQDLSLADPDLMEAIQRRAEAGPQSQPSAVKAAAEAWAAGSSAGRGGARRLPRPPGAADADGSSAVEDSSDAFGEEAFASEDEEAFLVDFAGWQAGAPAPAPAPAPSAGTAGTAGISAPPAPPQLPPAWANGFPLLRQLRVAGLNLSGPLPASWVNASWPRLELL